MRIAKPLLLVTTPIGLLSGFYECVKLAGGLVFIMFAMVAVMVAALASVIAVVRRESRAAQLPRRPHDAESTAEEDQCNS
jgi:hypothetical protein